MNTIIEKIRAEVERRKKELEKDKTIHPANQAGRIKELDLILSFLSDLEKSEKPMNPTIEKLRALIKMQIRREELNFASLGGGGQTMNIGALEWVLKQLDTLQEQPVKIDIRKELESIEFMGVNDARDTETIARHFYELGCRDTVECYKERSEELVCEGLDGEITEFISNNYEVDYHEGLKHLGEYLDTYDVEEIARHFAKWQKEKMMNEWLKDRDGCFWDGVEEGKKAMREQLMMEAVEWLQKNAHQYIINDTESYLDAPFKAHISGKCWEDFKKAIIKEDTK